MKDPQSEPRPRTVWDQFSGDGAAAGGYDLAANVLVGFGLGWLVQHFFGSLSPWGIVGGIILGSVSGFYQLFAAQKRSGKLKNPEKPPDHD